VVIHIEADRYRGVPSYESWWDVPVAEVAELQSTRDARRTYQERKRDQRPYVRPSDT
jgi:3D-(3,5/4)-trihydroxycyclohexane-1,2-dione acylhydrolase (decyclizing)